MSECPFCHPDASRIFHVGEHVLALWDAYPVSNGHALVITKAHRTDWFDATDAERAELTQSIEALRAHIEQRYDPDGYNIGVNVGAAGGQTVQHLHLHVIPRYDGDVPDATGGVRNVIPAKANYLESAASPPPPDAVAEASAPYGATDTVHLTTGEDDPLLPHLIRDVDQATRLDIAVAFVQRSGVERIRAHLEDFLDKPSTRLRIVTGDYLDISDPDALAALLDLTAGRDDVRAQVRIFESGGTSFHPKSYILQKGEREAVAYVGSSNLSASALTQGVEWNYRVVSDRNPDGFQAVVTAFEELFHHPQTTPLTEEWLTTYRDRRQDPLPLRGRVPEGREGVTDEPPEPEQPPATPTDIQKEALKALDQTRQDGNEAGLVVMATGLGKTYLAAFDTAQASAGRTLFVAHREEILRQARRTFRHVRPRATSGYYNGTDKTPDTDLVFASIQTLSRQAHLDTFEAGTFDYIVIDEFHHASAKTYRRLIDHFDPKFLLGLTATPERTDGGNLLELCGENLVYRCDLIEGVRRDQLVPFHYFGVPDDVDYRAIPWRSTRFDEEALTTAVATETRAQNVLDQYRDKAGERVLAFCCSQTHANFMRQYFQAEGIACAAVHSGDGSDPRATSLEKLRDGELQVVFAVDMFNEGLDVPEIDTVMMLRPTESKILWLQQFGRGLRKSTDKPHLTVVDYIGNHRTFLLKPQTLLDLPDGDAHIRDALQKLSAGTFDLPEGCQVTYDLQAVDVIQQLLREPKAEEQIAYFYRDFKHRNSQRPTATEAYHAGYNPRGVRKSHGSWLQFVNAMEDLDEGAQALLREAGEFLKALETTPMTKSYKMLVLRAMLLGGRFPGEVDIDELVTLTQRVARRRALLRDDVGEAIDDPARLRKLLEDNPIKAWTGGKGTGNKKFFRYEDGVFGTRLSIPDVSTDTFRELVEELVDWRMAEYLDRQPSTETSFIVKVNQAGGGQPILFPLKRDKDPGIPYGWTNVTADGTEYQFNFVKVAVNVAHRADDADRNVLPDLLRSWFGDNAGAPGTTHAVEFQQTEDGYVVSPLGQTADGPTLWERYQRRDIPPLFGLQFAERKWQQGRVDEGNHTFLFVTLQKKGMPEDHQYADHFLSPEQFQWQSQNRTAQHHKRGQRLLNHREMDVAIHLFIRRQSKRPDGKAEAFLYCGQLDFVQWEGNQPITIEWKLDEAIPQHLHQELMIHGND